MCGHNTSRPHSSSSTHSQDNGPKSLNSQIWINEIHVHNTLTATRRRPLMTKFGDLTSLRDVCETNGIDANHLGRRSLPRNLRHSKSKQWAFFIDGVVHNCSNSIVNELSYCNLALSLRYVITGTLDIHKVRKRALFGQWRAAIDWWSNMGGNHNSRDHSMWSYLRNMRCSSSLT